MSGRERIFERRSRPPKDDKEKKMTYSGIRGALRRGEIVEMEDGTKIKMVAGKETGELLKPGDLYFAERNTGPKLLYVRQICDANWAKNTGALFSGWVVPADDLAYSYDFGECVGVEIIPE